MGVILLAAGLPGCGLLGGGRAEDAPVLPADAPRIEREVAARLAAEPSIGPGRVRVVVQEGGTVSLHGSVQGIGALQCAIRNAGLVPGVRNVADFLVLERGPRDVRCLAPRPTRPEAPDTLPRPGAGG